MTNEQREAIEYIQKQIDYFKEQIKFIEAVDCDYYEEEYELYKNRIKQFSTVLSLIKEQQEEIAKYEKIYKEYDCYRWVKELNKKDKQIDLMAKKINEAYCDETSFYNWFEKTFGIRAEGDYSKEIKQYFAELAEKE